jgi:glucokinase
MYRTVAHLLHRSSAIQSHCRHAACAVGGALPAGEGAHATFAPRGWKQKALAAFAAQKLGGHVEVEQVCGAPQLHCSAVGQGKPDLC